MTQAQQGNTVKVHYKGVLEDGTVFDSSYEKEPLEFTIGDGRIIPGFESAVVGMSQGESKKVTITPEEGYGDYQEQGKVEVNRENMPEDIQPEPGMMLQLNTPEEKVVYVTVTDMDEEKVTLDANHPLAGKDLHFEIELLEIA